LNSDKVGRLARENAELIWNAANSLSGVYKPHEFGLVVLPMCIIKRLHDCLQTTSDYPFHNTSGQTFHNLIADPENLEKNFTTFLDGFSDNVQQILELMQFRPRITFLAKTGILHQLIVDFSGKDLGPDRISTVDMGYIFENLVQRFSESHGEEAGAHFTSRDIVYLMCDLLLADHDVKASCTVYDMTMGTSQMLTCMKERLTQRAPGAEIRLFGQEINPFTMAIAAADTLIQGGDVGNMKLGNTLTDDQFSGHQFDLIISNPPFGVDWKRESNSVTEEHQLGKAGRFAPGLPAKNDGQMLFLLNGLKKLKDNGRMAIIQSGSSLFAGDAGSGPSKIRKYLIQDNDWLDAIVRLPIDSFYNTAIATYIWIIDKNKPLHRRGKVQLIDASSCYRSRKSIGSKRRDIGNASRELILRAYENFKTDTIEGQESDGKPILCKSYVTAGTSFGYHRVVVETPLRNEDGTPILRRGKIIPDVSRRDTENIPLTEKIDDYIAREVLPYQPEAWIDQSKTKVGYEIPFSQIFHEYREIESSTQIAARITAREQQLSTQLRQLFSVEGRHDL
jgi:type I restriction enzyme M protein